MLFILASSLTFGQKVMIGFSHGVMYAGMDNLMSIIARQDKPVDRSQVLVSSFGEPTKPIEIKGNNGFFTIKSQKVGLILVSVIVEGDTIVKRIKVHPLIPWLYLGGRYDLGHHLGAAKKMKVEEIKAQLGVSAIVMNLDIDAHCKVMGFEMIRITADGQAFTIFNLGGHFSEEALDLISKTKSGDTYIFRKVKCRCPGTKTMDLSDGSIDVE